MSFTTNPIANRLNINKGWNYSTFPETLSFYSRDNVFLFKLFLFVKAYFNLSKIKLVTCDIRRTEGQIHILYLVLNTTLKLKKKKIVTLQHKRFSRSGVLQSPFINPNYIHAAQLLYLEFPFLKKVIRNSVVPLCKQSPTRWWLTKHRQKSWSNYLELLFTLRKKNRHLIQNFILKKNEKNINTLLQLRAIMFIKEKTVKEFFFLLTYLKILQKKNNLAILNASFFQLYNKKLKLFLKTTKKIQTLTRLLLKINSKLPVFHQTATSTLIRLLTKDDIVKKKKRLKRIIINQFNYYRFLQKKPRFYQSTSHFLRLSQKWTSSLKKFVINNQCFKSTSLNVFWTVFSYQNLILMHDPKIFYKKWQAVTWIYLFKRSLFLKVIQKRNKTISFPLSQYTPNRLTLKKFLHLNWNSQKNFNNLFSFSLRRRQKFKQTPFLLALFKQLRSIKKNKKTYSLAKEGLKWKLTKNFQNEFLVKKNNSNWIYRENFRKAYLKNFNLSLRYQFRFHLKKFLLDFFKINFQVKFVQPLVEHKNYTFFRLIYKLNDKSRNKRRHTLKKKNNIKNMLQSKIKKFQQVFKHRFNKNKYVFHSQQLPQNHSPFIVCAKKHKKLYNYEKLHKYPFIKKPEFYQRLRQTTTRLYAPSKFQSIKKKLLLQYFVPTVMLFVKYLNPQLLADHLAREFEKTKRHRTIIFALKSALRSIRFTRAKGYKICIRGRINSAQKTQTFYFSRNAFSLQTLKQNINFAHAQSNARIGAFGINVWLYF